MINRARLGIVMSGSRLTAAVARPGRILASFVVASADNPSVALRAELATRKLRARRVRLGLARNLVTVKPLDLPPTNEGDLRQMVQFEIDRHVPHGAEETAFDFAPLPGANGHRRVLVAAAERRLVDRALRVAADSKLRPVSVTVAAHDLPALLAGRPPRRAVWAHTASETTDLLFLEGRNVRLSRSLPVGDSVTLAADIRASLAMLRWDDADALWISGDDADGHLVSPAIQSLGIRSGPPPLSRTIARALATSRDPLDGVSWLAVGVALGRGRRRLNLLPPALRPRRPGLALVMTAAMLVITAGLGAATVVLHGARDAERLARLDAEIRRLDADVMAIERLRADLDRRRRLLATVQSVEAGGLHPLPVLRELTDALPPDAWLTTLSLDRNGVEMTGQATGASSLIPVLENSPRLERVEFASPVTRGRDKEQFRIKAAWEAPPAPLLPPSPPQAASPQAARPPSARTSRPPAAPAIAAPPAMDGRDPGVRDR